MDSQLNVKCSANDAHSFLKRHNNFSNTRRWILLNVWYRYLYHHFMKTLHKFDLHYAPVSLLSPPFGRQEHHCRWCGLRGNTFKIDPSAPLEPSISDNVIANHPRH